MTDNLVAVEALAAAAEGNPAAMAKVAELYSRIGENAKARLLSQRAAALAPGDLEIADIAARLRVADVPKWHFNMLRDDNRNKAYHAALRRVVTPGCRVLDIGAGSGLLAMMAAQAGAGEVITCEMNDAVAACATDIVRQNGFSDRVRVVAKHSKDLTIDDLGGPADVLVSEIIASDLLSEGVLPVMENVIPRLLKPGAAIIPAQGSVRVGLVEDLVPGRNTTGVVEGFDLSRFNDLAHPTYRLLRRAELALRSAPADLFRFDFASGGPYQSAKSDPITLVATGGLVTAIAQWIWLGLDSSNDFENPPSSDAPSSWYVTLKRLSAPRMMEAGEKLTLYGRHTRDGIRIWAETLD